MTQSYEGKTVLLVDDDKLLIDMYSIKFNQAKFKVEPVFSGEEALEKLRGGLKPDLILFDIIMPGLSGLEFLATARQENLAPDAAYVVLSNQGQPNDIDEAKKNHVDGYIIKANTLPSEVLDQALEILSRRNK